MPSKPKTRGRALKKSNKVRTHRRNEVDVETRAASPGESPKSKHRQTVVSVHDRLGAKRQIVFDESNALASVNNNAAVVVEKDSNNQNQMPGRSRSRSRSCSLSKDRSKANAMLNAQASKDINIRPSGRFLADDVIVDVSADEDIFAEEMNTQEMTDGGSESDQDEGEFCAEVSVTTDNNSNLRRQSGDIQEPVQRLVKEQLAKEKAQQNAGNKGVVGNTTVGASNLDPTNSDQGKAKQVGNTNNLVKSPSDTTIYASALCMRRDTSGEVGNKFTDQDCDQIKRITDFIQQVHFADRELQTPEGQDDKMVDKAGTSTSRQMDEREKLEDARAKADQLILDAEKTRANIQPLKGNGDFLDTIRNEGQGSKQSNVNGESDVDDEFFHITCHIEEGLQHKIKCSEFVELEKLLPKPKRVSGDDRMELVFKDGSTYFTPKVREQKINNVRKWEQAFRVYAAIYSKANPSRAVDIWQYVYVINSAAGSFIWENVANYDFIFRQLMAARPFRSWAKTYTQMWSMCMRDAIPRNGQKFVEFL